MFIGFEKVLEYFRRFFNFDKFYRRFNIVLEGSRMYKNVPEDSNGSFKVTHDSKMF